jgi:hypothetical protein
MGFSKNMFTSERAQTRSNEHIPVAQILRNLAVEMGSLQSASRFINFLYLPRQMQTQNIAKLRSRSVRLTILIWEEIWPRLSCFFDGSLEWLVEMFSGGGRGGYRLF